MGSFSLWHWLVVIILVLLLFGRGRISDMMGDIGKGLKSFKKGMADEEEEKQQRHEEQRRLAKDDTSRSEPIDVTPRSPEPAAEPPRDEQAR
jgi:sec-independent protein translocase protein TatA